MSHEESRLQQQCVTWFRAQYPQYAMLLTHPANEGNGNRVTGAIHKAEGTMAGVPDLLLFMPTVNYVPTCLNQKVAVTQYNGLGIEFKTKTGRQSQQQKDFQKIFEAANYCYLIIRDFDTFRKEVTTYIGKCFEEYRKRIASVHVEIEQAARKREKDKFMKVIGKK